MKTVIEMARKSGFLIDGVQEFVFAPSSFHFTEELKRFAELVRADEREKYKWDVHSCGPTCTKAACVAMREAVEAEREACAKVCDEQAERSKLAMEKSKRTTDHAVYRAGAQTAAWNAAEIRARRTHEDRN